MGHVLDAMALDMLGEVGSIGAGRAATSLSTMTGRRVEISVPSATLVAVDAVADQVGGIERQMAAVHLLVSGDLSGHILYLMPPHEAVSLAHLLLQGKVAREGQAALQSVAGAPLSELALSAMQETGSILAHSYLIALGQLTGLESRLSPPGIGVDMAGSLVDGVLAAAAATSDVVLLIETVTSADGLDEGGTFLFLPSPRSMETIVVRLERAVY